MAASFWGEGGSLYSLQLGIREVDCGAKGHARNATALGIAHTGLSLPLMSTRVSSNRAAATGLRAPSED